MVIGEGSVSNWIVALRGNDHEAAQRLWDRYFKRLLGVARNELAKRGPKAVNDDEDVALSAFHAFCRGLNDGQYPDLQNRDDLWGLLVVIAARKANDRAKGDLAQKRGGGQVALSLDALTADQLMRLCEEQPDPHMAALIAEEWTRLLESLDEPLQHVVLWKLEGLTNSEISERSGCTRQTIQRRLRLIRETWENS